MTLKQALAKIAELEAEIARLQATRSVVEHHYHYHQVPVQPAINPWLTQPITCGSGLCG